MINNPLVLFILAVVPATLVCKIAWQQYQQELKYAYLFTGLSRLRYPIQLLGFSLITYSLLILLHLITKQDQFFLDAFMPHTIVTAGALILLIAATTALTVPAFLFNAIDLGRITWELAGIIKARITR